MSTQSSVNLQAFYLITGKPLPSIPLAASSTLDTGVGNVGLAVSLDGATLAVSNVTSALISLYTLPEEKHVITFGGEPGAPDSGRDVFGEYGRDGLCRPPIAFI